MNDHDNKSEPADDTAGHMVRLSRYPYLKTAIETDGAIRIADGRWSRGFVNDEQLSECLALKLLVVEHRHGMRFAVLPNANIERLNEDGQNE